MQRDPCLNTFSLPFGDEVIQWLLPASYGIIFLIGGVIAIAYLNKWIKWNDAILLAILVLLILAFMALPTFWSMAGIDYKESFLWENSYQPIRPGCKNLYHSDLPA